MTPPLLEDENEARGRRDPDILAEERERRLRQRRGLRSLWLGNWLTGRTGVVFLCIFLVVGLGWLVFQRMDSGGSDVRAHVSAAVPERVRDLTASEHALASGYGEPLYMGPGGLPVLRFESTGQVREMTPMEVDSDAPFVYLSTPGGRIIESTGPRAVGCGGPTGPRSYPSGRGRPSTAVPGWNVRRRNWTVSSGAYTRE